MFEQCPIASDRCYVLLKALELLDAQQHKTFAQLMFPKYMKNDGVNFIFNDELYVKQNKLPKGRTTSHFCWLPIEITKHEALFDSEGLDIFQKTPLRSIIGCIYDYINTLSSSDVEKLKKLVDKEGNIYPLLEIYLSEIEYFFTDIVKHPDISRWFFIPFFNLSLFIRKNLDKIFNLYWVHPDILDVTPRFYMKSLIYREYIDLPILPFWYEIGKQGGNASINTACDLTREYYFDKLTQEQKDVFTSTLTELPETGWVRIDKTIVKVILGSCYEPFCMEGVE